MNTYDAAKVLNLSGTVTPDDVKKSYRKAAMKYHPDRNKAGLKMMKIVNSAFECLKNFNGTIPSDSENLNSNSYSEAVNEALNSVVNLDGLEIEICGAWVWVSGETKKHKEALKKSFFRYASKKKSWYFRPEGWRSTSRGTYSMDDIRGLYGSNKPNQRRRNSLAQPAKEA